MEYETFQILCNQFNTAVLWLKSDDQITGLTDTVNQVIQNVYERKGNDSLIVFTQANYSSFHEKDSSLYK